MVLVRFRFTMRSSFANVFPGTAAPPAAPPVAVTQNVSTSQNSTLIEQLTQSVPPDINIITNITTPSVVQITHNASQTGNDFTQDHFLYYMIAGAVFLSFAAWWFINILGRYFHSLGKTNLATKYESTSSYPCNCCPCGKNGTLEIEGITKILIAITAVILSVINHISRAQDGTDLPLIHNTNVKVTTIVVFFGMQGFVDVITHVTTFIPRGLEYIGCSLGFFIEGVLLGSMKWNDTGNRLVDLHAILVYIAYVTALCVALEMMWRHVVHISLVKASLVMLQGLWLWQIAFRAMSNDYEQSVTLLFAWTTAIVFIFMLFLSLLMGAAYRCCGGEATEVDYYKYDGKDGAITQLIKRDSNGHTIINFNDDSDSETEFDQGLLSKGK